MSDTSRVWAAGLLPLLLGLHLVDSAAAQGHVALEVVGQWPPSGIHAATRVAVAGNHVYLSGRTGFDILDVSEPNSPRLVGVYSNALGVAYGAQVVGNLVFLSVFAGERELYGGMEIIDVSNRQQPQRLSRVSQGDSYDLQVVPPYAYVTDFYRGLEVYDVRDVLHPELVTRYPAGNLGPIRIQNDLAYVAAFFGGLKLISVETPNQPELVGSIGAGEIRDVDVNDAGSYAFLADTYDGLLVVNLANPSMPQLTAKLRLKGFATALRAVGDHVFVTADEPPLQVVDVSNRAQPVLVGTLAMAGGAQALEVVGSMVYLVTSEGRLLLLRSSETPLGFSAQPSDLQVQTGQTATFSAPAVSVAPFTYQWRKDGIDVQDDGRLSGTRTANLTISNAALSDEGCYSAVVSNRFGMVVSSNGCLTVVRGLREALDDPNLVWYTSGTRPFQFQTDMTHDGVDAAEGGPLQAGFISEANRINTQVDGPGTLSFWWRLEDADCFQFAFSVGSTTKARIGPQQPRATNWQQQTIRIASGIAQTLRWDFSTMCGDGSPPGRAWLDEVSYVRDSPPTITLTIRIRDENHVVVNATSTPGTRVRLEFSADLVSWQPVGSPETVPANGILTLLLGRLPGPGPIFLRAVEAP